MKSVIIFSKYPIAGQVKTRLTHNTCLTHEDTAKISLAMIKDTILLCGQSDVDEIIIGFSPDIAQDLFKKLINELRLVHNNFTKCVNYISQNGQNFDERFESCVKNAFEHGSDQIIILGSDLPFLPPDIINDAFIQLNDINSLNKIVLGLASGGGIYLVGLNRRFQTNWITQYQLFRGGIEINQFITLCKVFELKLHLLPAYSDIDLEEDLISLLLFINALKICTSSKGYWFPKYTAEIIEKMALNVQELSDNTRHRVLKKVLYA